MSRHELSTFLQRVLDAIDHLPDGVMVDGSFEPDACHLQRLAREVGAEVRDVREAVMGLEASACLIQETIGFPGIETIHFWKVHPQLRSDDGAARPKYRPTVRKDCG